jgi:hypothetical protein
MSCITATTFVKLFLHVLLIRNVVGSFGTPYAVLLDSTSQSLRVNYTDIHPLVDLFTGVTYLSPALSLLVGAYALVYFGPTTHQNSAPCLHKVGQILLYYNWK